MIIAVNEIKSNPIFDKVADAELERRLVAIERLIRSHTNNNFQVRAARFEAASSDGVLMGASPYIRAGETVQISQSGVNDGLYVVITSAETTMVNGELFDAYNRVTKINYPADVVEGAVAMLIWEYDPKGKAMLGVKSESLSRHSLTYTDTSRDSLVKGYPAGMLDFLKPYMRANI